MMISLILPVYNVAPYLRDCLNSLINQTVGEWEAICVDDGSTDESGDILDEYVARDCRIKAIHQCNSGVCAARNNAIKSASGEWISFIDPDDVIHPRMLEWMIEGVAKFSNVDVISFSNVQFKDGMSPVWPANDNSYEPVDLSVGITSRMAAMCVCGALYRRSIMPKHGFRPYSIGEDLLFVAECLVNARTGVVCNRTAYGYRQRAGSATHCRMTRKRLLEHIAYTRSMVEALSQSGKRIDRDIYRGLGLKMTESTVLEIMLLPADERGCLWQIWYKELEWMRNVNVFPAWTTFVVVVCSSVRVRFLAWLLCALPRRIKLMGIHRGILRVY